VNRASGTRGSSTKTSSPLAEFSSRQQFDQCGFVDDRAARDVDEHALGPECFQHGPADQAQGRRAAWAGRDQYIRLAGECNEVRLVAPRQVLCARPVPCDRHAECRRPHGDRLSDAPHADDAERLAAHFLLHGHRAAQPAAGTHITVSACNAAHRCQHQADGEVGDIVGQYVRRVRDGDAVFARGNEIDRVDADAEAGDQTQQRQASIKARDAPAPPVVTRISTRGAMRASRASRSMASHRWWTS